MDRREFAGLPIVVENKAGTVRQWYDRDGKVSGQTAMRHDYGFIDGHVGVDGDEVDCYLGPDERAAFAYVVHQRKAPEFEKHDEDKVMLGFASEADAKAAYLAHRNDGERAYGGMSAIPIGDFTRKLERRTGSGKIRHEIMTERQPMTAPLMALMDGIPQPGQVRAGVWDRFTTWGPSRKVEVGPDGKPYVAETRFDEVTLSQIIDNFVARGVKVPMDWNHQSAYSKLNGQPAESLARYACLAIVVGGRVVKAGALKGYEATPVDPVSSPDLWPSELGDGLYGFRSEVTPKGQQVLPNMAGISPMFLTNGTDEQGNKIGYVLNAVAATDVPFQGDRGDGAPGITFQRGDTKMARKFSTEMAKRMGFEADADDTSVKAAYQKRMEGATKAFEEAVDGEPAKMGGAKHFEDEAKRLDEEAKAYEDEFPAEKEGPHVVMRKMAARYARLAKMAKMEEGAGGGGAPHKEPDGDEMQKKMEAQAQTTATALAQRLGVKLPAGLNAAQMFDAISASAVPTSQIPSLVQAQLKKELDERDAKRLRDDTAKQAEQLVTMAIEAGYPAENKSALLAFASEPKSFEAAKAVVLSACPKLKETIDQSVLFERMTSGGAPLQTDGRQRAVPTEGEQKIVKNALATFVISDDEFARKARGMADAKDGAVKMEIDGMLSEIEQKNPGDRLIAAQRLLKTKEPELWARVEAREMQLGR